MNGSVVWRAALVQALAVAGIPSLVTVLLGAHWAGVPIAVGVFAAWCGWLAGPRSAQPRREGGLRNRRDDPPSTEPEPA